MICKDFIMIEEKYNIKYIDRIRCYKFDLSLRQFNLDYCSPRELIIDDKSIFETSWIHMLERLINYLVHKHSLEKEKLLEFRVEWTNREIFQENKETISFYGPLENGLYFDGNHSSTHLLWIIQDILVYFGELVNEIHLYVKIPVLKEEKEVVKYFKEKSLEMLIFFLKNRLNFDSVKLEGFIKNFYKVDKVFEKLFKNQVSLLLMETKLIYSTYKSRFLEQLRNNQGFLKYEKTFTYVLDCLTLFYAYSDENYILS